MPSTPSKIAFIASPTGVTIYLDGEQHSVNNDHPNIKHIRTALNRKDVKALKGLLNIADSARAWGALIPGFSVQDGVLALNGEPFARVISEKVIAMMRDGFDATPLLKFLQKLRANPSATAQRELLLFCEANSFLIDEDGDIIAYKGVRDNYMDVHSGTYDNHVGRTNEMERRKVDDNRDRTCSYGLHFASREYADNFIGKDGHLMVLKISPTDVVSIPSDYANQKGRCCKYTVIAEVPQHHRATGIPTPKAVLSARDLDPTRWDNRYNDQNEDEIDEDARDDHADWGDPGEDAEDTLDDQISDMEWDGSDEDDDDDLDDEDVEVECQCRDCLAARGEDNEDDEDEDTGETDDEGDDGEDDDLGDDEDADAAFNLTAWHNRKDEMLRDMKAAIVAREIREVDDLYGCLNAEGFDHTEPVVTKWLALHFPNWVA